MLPAEFDEQSGLWIQRVPRKDWYSVMDCQIILRSGGPSIRGSIKRGTLKGHKVNGVVHVSHENLVAYIESRVQVSVIDMSDLMVEAIEPDPGHTKREVIASLLKDKPTMVQAHLANPADPTEPTEPTPPAAQAAPQADLSFLDA